ncbi:endogenous retrovirus group k member 9 gag poly [Limosa lapponica baueri]|uniref:Endogenous retrovirus group k member 9 gag poly n=1 Tax=Limosa lapponica baueri TaxID=1758121 RepID=A0A2I0T3C6_LIMLA|nr:endogenous retrovirus group k member 9 gag poly [Limosa lapponica baueri]
MEDVDHQGAAIYSSLHDIRQEGSSWKHVEKGFEDGDIEMFQAMPAIYRPQQLPHYETLTYEVIKELRKWFTIPLYY